jgi:hypothetical protein
LVQGLRNIVQHEKLPRLLGHASHAPGQAFTSKVRFDPDDLLVWKGWNADMRKYLQESGDTVDLDEVVIEYRDAVVGFHEWFASAVRQRNNAALKELERGKKELADYGSTLFGPSLSDP